MSFRNHRFAPLPTVLAAAASLASAAAQAPATAPHWSTFLGGSGHDVAAAVRLGPGGLVTVVGTTTSTGLASPAAFQTALAGGADAFVARFDPSQPPAQQLLWLTYLGGGGDDVALDAVVDASGFTTVVGMTYSPDFPMSSPGLPTTGFQTARNGPSDGFVARIDPSGSVMTYATHLGGSLDDRICTVAFDAAGALAVCGVTTSTDLPATAGTLFPSYLGGGTDAFVARIDPAAAVSQQLRWATHLGGPAQDGAVNAALSVNGGLGVFWEGNLRRQLVAVMANDDVVAVTVTNPGPAYQPGSTTAGAFQPNGAGLNEVYLAQLDPTGSALRYGTFLGGVQREFPYALGLHPRGGFVIAGSTSSPGLPVTPGAVQPTHSGGVLGFPDAFVCWIDPAAGSGAQQLRYGTFLGGNAGEDLITAVAFEPSGLVTLAGTGFGGGTVAQFPTTAGSLRPAAASTDRCGALLRLDMQDNGAADLVYSTLIGGAWTVMMGVALDEVGDAFVVGATDDVAYPTANGYQATSNGPREAALTHLPLLAGGTGRLDLAAAVPACPARLYGGALGPPQVGNAGFGLCATNAPPAALGACVLGLAPALQPLDNVTLLVQPADVGIVLADAAGFARRAVPIPATAPLGVAVHAQWLFLTNAACPGTGALAGSERLVLTTF